MTAKQKTHALIIIATLLRCIVATTISLGNDEVYYLSYAQHLQWNYFDHPPMVALLIRITTLNLNFVNEFTVRLGPILLAAANTWLIYKIASGLKNQNAGFIAALLFSASFYSSIIAGVFIMPDAPQLFFWLTATHLLISLFTTQPSPQKTRNLLLSFGLITGLCIMSKVHGVFLWLGVILYTIRYRRDVLQNPYLYCSLALTALCISPIFLWNAENHFITYTFHSSRVTPARGINVTSFIREVFGGMFYNNPINYCIYVVTLWSIAKNKTTHTIPPAQNLLLLLSLPLITILLIVSLFRDTLPHWSGPAYTALMLLSATQYEEKITAIFYRRATLYATVFTTVIALTGIAMINFYPGTLGKKDQNLLGKGDVTLDMYGWRELKNDFDKIRKQNTNNGLTDTSFIITNKWFPGAHIDNYVALPLKMNFVALGKLEDIHTYAWLNSYRKPLKKGNDAYYITTSTNFTNPEELYANDFDSILPPKIITQKRNGKPAKQAFIYLLKNYRPGNNELQIKKPL